MAEKVGWERVANRLLLVLQYKHKQKEGALNFIRQKYFVNHMIPRSI